MRPNPSDDLAVAPLQAAKENVVMIHCSAGSAEQWHSLVERLAPAYETIAVELRGHGCCEVWRGDGPLSLAAEVDGIARTVKDKRRFHLVGHSYGGSVALRFACSQPERIASLTLIEPSCFHILKEAGEDSHLLDEIDVIAGAVSSAVVCGDYRSGTAAFIDYWCGAGTWARLNEERRVRLADHAVHIAHHFWSLVGEETPLAAYVAVEAPTLILCGTKSPNPSRAITRLLAQVMPNAKHRTIANVGHMAPVTHPDEVNPIIRGHLQQNPIGRTTLADETLPANQEPFGDRSTARAA